MIDLVRLLLLAAFCVPVTASAADSGPEPPGILDLALKTREARAQLRLSDADPRKING